MHEPSSRGSRRIPRALGIVSSVLCGLGLACAGPGEGSAPLRTLRSSAPRVSGERVSQSTFDRFARRTRKLELELYARALRREGNVVIAPYAAAASLGMLYGATAGETRREVKRALELTAGPPSAHIAFNATDQALRGRSDERMTDPRGVQGGNLDVQLTYRGVVRKGVQIQPAYLELLSRYYGAELLLADLARSSEREAVSTWVSERTGGRIQALLPAKSSRPEARFALASTCLLEASWLIPFDRSRTNEETFASPTGPVPVSMMHGTAELYAEGDGFQAFRLHYVSAGLSVIFVLPAEGRLEEVERRFTPRTLGRLLVDLSRPRYRVSLKIPRFAVGSTFALEQDLVTLGIRRAFHPTEADLSLMTKESGPLLEEVYHGAFFSVDEEGTDAEAAPRLKLRRGTGLTPVELHLTRPFLFLALDLQTGQILLAGRIVDPSVRPVGRE